MRDPGVILVIVACVVFLVGAVTFFVRTVQQCEANGGIYVSRFDPCVEKPE